MSSHHSPTLFLPSAMPYDASVLPTHEFILESMEPLARNRGRTPYLDDCVMNKLRIERSHLEFDPTIHAPDPNALLKLMPEESMTKLARKFHFWSHDGTIASSDYDDDPFTQACTFTEVLDIYLDSTLPSEDITSPVLLDDFIWEVGEFPPDQSRIINYSNYEKNCHWNVDFALWVRDCSRPHIQYALSQSDSLEDGKVTLGEVWTLLTVTGCFFDRPEYARFDFIPVTIVSVSGMKARIVQGYADAKTRRITLRTIPVIDFGPGHERERTYWTKFQTLLRWLLAEPLGTFTKGSDTDVVGV
ncbi:hypothetical protein F4808DRAFT_458190 [Astrocystis sublimbata]|nr:hypothetical protein F4808DRAFT_458190 [Astrocystis sublimbata]